MLQAVLIFLANFLGNISPLSTHMQRAKFGEWLSRLLKSSQRVGCCMSRPGGTTIVAIQQSSILALLLLVSAWIPTRRSHGMSAARTLCGNTVFLLCS